MSKIRQEARQLPFIVRAIWFIFVGWELTAVWIAIAWFLNAIIIGLPLGLWMIDRVPQVLTLKARTGAWEYDGETGRGRFQGVRQLFWPARAVYFVLFGWWFSLIWASIGWFFCATIIGLPIGIWMLHRLPAVTTLQRG